MLRNVLNVFTTGRIRAGKVSGRERVRRPAGSFYVLAPRGLGALTPVKYAIFIELSLLGFGMLIAAVSSVGIGICCRGRLVN